ncbi:MAG: prepilin-type N-terminal cleavage/methylation domain-containing protein [candidate division Zixibacteria bacterium]|nr:prepilin-type N-terminal cleavage/methylation domain-containing protein [candidate division Zixibacteria bacterium]
MNIFRKKQSRVNSKGFTLIELMIVVVIIGILAAMAIPRWWKASERTKQSEAKLILKQIFTNQETYFQANTTYFITGSTASAGNPDAFAPIWVEILAGALYEYNIAGDATSFTATATANLDADGTIDTWTINQDGVLTRVTDDTMD